MRFTRAVYRVLLRLYPREFRERFGREMLQSFDASCREAMNHGPIAFARFVVAIFTDLLGSAAMERFASEREAAASIVPADGPTFGMIHGEPPRLSAAIAGTLITLVTLGAIVTAIDRSAIQHWRQVFFRAENRPGAFNGSLGM